MNPDPTDEELMASYQKGNKEAFRELVTRHQSGIYNFLYRFLNQKQNVEEAFQEVFLRMIKASSSYTPTAKFSTWIYTIARNYCIDRSRNRGLAKTVYLEDQEQDRFSNSEVAPDELTAAYRLNEQLKSALDQINPDQKEVFLLRVMQGFSFEEISEMVKCSIPTTKSRMRYALQTLQEILKKRGFSNPK